MKATCGFVNIIQDLLGENKYSLDFEKQMVKICPILHGVEHVLVNCVAFEWSVSVVYLKLF